MSNSGITKYERKHVSICIMWFHVCAYLCAYLYVLDGYWKTGTSRDNKTS